MVMLNQGLNQVRDLIYADIDKGQLGTGTTKAVATDTDLETADATTELDTTNTTGDKSIRFDYTLPSTGGSTATYTEFCLLESTGDTEYDRMVFTGVDFTNNGNNNLVISKVYYIRSLT